MDAPAEKRTLAKAALPGLLPGLIGGLTHAMLLDAGTNLGPFVHLVWGGIVGVGFGACFGWQVLTAGSGLMWGMTYALLAWIAAPLTLFPLVAGGRPDWTLDAMRSAFPSLLGYLVVYGAWLGLAYRFSTVWIRKTWKTRDKREVLAEFASSLIIGGMAGLVGGFAFGAWMERVGIFPLIAGLMGSDSADVGRAVHFTISVIIGASYGVFFRHDIRGPGSSVAWGLAYGMIWWLLGPLTIMPLWLGGEVQWSLKAAEASFASLVGHVVYGILLGLVYSVVDRTWRRLFIESDPLKREPEGPGTRNLRAAGLGILASIAGGLAFTIVMAKTGALPAIASLIGQTSPMTGFWVHMTISVIIGATYGVLFRHEAYTYGAGLIWGLVYGLVWWFLGPLTLMPILLGGSMQWSLEAAVGGYPSLIGHLAYGGTTALVYHLLIIRYDPTVRNTARRLARPRERPPGTLAPALWVVVLMLGVTLPVILSGGLDTGRPPTRNPCAAKPADRPHATPARPNPCAPGAIGPHGVTPRAR